MEFEAEQEIEPMTQDGYFDEAVAETYDARHQTDPATIEATVRLLAELCENGPALEFAIGTGRIALPLQEKGVTVSGIELSSAMAQKLKGKPGAASIDVTVGDMVTTRLEGDFSLVYLVFNTIDNLISQNAQIACFENAANHLRPGGRFLIETLVPPLQKLPVGQNQLAFSRSDGHWGIDEFDVATQHYTSHHSWFNGGSCERISVPFRYAWPAELDLMARIAGLKLESRWADWNKSPFDAQSDAHISVWRKPLQ